MAALAAELTRIRGPAAGAGPCAARLCSGHLTGHSRAARLRSGHLVGHSPLASGRLDAHWLAGHRLTSRRMASHRLTSHRLTSHRLTSRRLASHRLIARWLTSHRMASHPRHSGISGHLARGLVHLHLLHVGVGCSSHKAASGLHAKSHAHEACQGTCGIGARVL